MKALSLANFGRPSQLFARILLPQISFPKQLHLSTCNLTSFWVTSRRCFACSVTRASTWQVYLIGLLAHQACAERRFIQAWQEEVETVIPIPKVQPILVMLAHASQSSLDVHVNNKSSCFLAGVWSPAGGWWADPKYWRRNTALAFG